MRVNNKLLDVRSWVLLLIYSGFYPHLANLFLCFKGVILLLQMGKF